MPEGDSEYAAIERELDDRYQIVRTLGSGASGAVYLARERQLHRMVAIKVLHVDHAWSEAERARLRSEARTVANLIHPGIVPLLAFGETANTAYMVMPYVSGETLADRLAREGRLSPDDVRAYLAALADALAYAHREGVVHRDLKPENVLLVSDGERLRPVLADFGVAVFPSRDLGVGVARENAGTAHFMSPEQALGETELDGRSDIFALGALGYLMLVGTVPFDGSSSAVIIARICAGERVPLRVAVPEAPADLVAAIDKCLETNPAERWRRAGELRDALLGGAEAKTSSRVLGVLSAPMPRHGDEHADARHASARPARSAGGQSTRDSRGHAADMHAARRSFVARVFAGLGGDVRFAVRTLRKTPGFTAAVVLTLALGIGATTVVFSAIEALLLRQLPVADPASLVVLQEHRERMNVNKKFDASTFPYVRYLAYRKATSSIFVGLGAQSPRPVSVRSGDAARLVSGLVTSGNYFELLGIRPALGRFYTAAEDQSGEAESVAVVGYDYWTNVLGGTPKAIGQTLWVDSRPLTVVGVAPPGFRGAFASLPYPVDVWMPAAVFRPPTATSSDTATAEPDYQWMNLFGRLRPGVDITHASSALHVIGVRVPAVDPRTRLLDAWVEPLGPMAQTDRRTVERFLSMLLAAAGLVLLIAITNAAGMLLARSAARGREVATRLAVGATRGQLVRQLLVECAVLCVVAGGVALFLTWWLVRLIDASSLLSVTPLAIRFGLNPTVLVAAAAIVLGAVLLSGLVPAMHVTRVDLAGAMKEGGLRGGTYRARLRRTFVVVQLALSVVLLHVAGLFVRSLQQTLAINPGFQAGGVVHASVSLNGQGYDRQRARVLFTQLLAQLRARPEIEAASVAELAPLRGGYSRSPVTVPGRPDGENVTVQWGYAGVGFIELLRTPLLAGRTFTRADMQSGAHVTVINQTLAERLWPGENPRQVLGRDVVEEFGQHHTVIGVMANGKYASLQEAPRSYAYVPFPLGGSLSVNLYVRTRSSTSAAIRAMRAELAKLDPNVALGQPMPLTADISRYLLPQRIGVFLVGTFGLVGLVLATTGLYGVLAYGVAQRQREFGVRIALGAGAGSIVRLVVRNGLVIVVLGIALGLAGASFAGRLVSAFLYGVSPADPLTLIAVPLVLLLVAVLASVIPARRAAAADPMVSLRAE